MSNKLVAWIEPITESVMKDYDYQNNLFANETGDWIPLYTHPSEHDLGIAEAIGFEKGHKSAEDMLRQQQAEIEALKELNTMLKDAIEKRIGMDAERYKWLRAEFAAGRETHIGNRELRTYDGELK